VGSGIPVRIRDLAAEIIKQMGLLDVTLEYTMQSWPGDIKAWVADRSKIGSLGFAPQITLERGLAETIAYLAQAPLPPQ